jgi:hypothetical protein
MTKLPPWPVRNERDKVLLRRWINLRLEEALDDELWKSLETTPEKERQMEKLLPMFQYPGFAAYLQKRGRGRPPSEKNQHAIREYKLVMAMLTKLSGKKRRPAGREEAIELVAQRWRMKTSTLAKLVDNAPKTPK